MGEKAPAKDLGDGVVRAQEKGLAHYLGNSFELHIPTRWEDRTMITLAEPGEVEFRHSIVITQQTLEDEDISVEKYGKQQIKELNESLDDFRMSGGRTIKFNGHTAYQARFTWRSGKQPIVQLQTYLVHRAHAYAITCTATPKSYKEYLPLFNLVTQSFAVSEGGG